MPLSKGKENLIEVKQGLPASVADAGDSPLPRPTQDGSPGDLQAIRKLVGIENHRGHVRPLCMVWQSHRGNLGIARQ